MATDMTRTTPSGASITESDYQTIKKEATKETVKSILAIVGAVSVAIFVRNRMNMKDIVPPVTK